MHIEAVYLIGKQSGLKVVFIILYSDPNQLKF
jgi:hypothetical protein